MEGFLFKVKEHFRGRWIVLILLLVGSLFCTLYAANGNFPLAAAICAVPFFLIVTGILVNHPAISFLVLFTVNYGIMGIIRYVSFPLPISVAMDVLFLSTLGVLCVNQIRGKVTFKQETIPFLLLYGVWVVFCLIQAFNNTTGVGFQFAPWFKEVRPMAFHALYVILIFTLLFDKSKQIKYFLYVWGGFILLATVKVYIQRNQGFDSYELAWLWSVGARTHFIHSGIRYFSFFSDAANFGSNMAFSMVTYAVCFLYERNKYSRIYFLIIAVAAGYGMFMAGTRSALMVAIAGFVLYTLLSRNVRLFMISFSFIVLSVGLLKFTTIGQGNQFVRRMRTAFDPEDASLQVRLNNQKAIKSYMSEAPWGIGLGVGMGADQLPQNNKYWIVSVTPSDSTLVYIWMRTGAVGLILFLLLMSLAVIAESFIVLFRVRDKELRGILTAFTCGSACMLVAAYGNNIYTQYPNTLLIFGLQTLVFMGPYFDKQIVAEKERKALGEKEREEEKDALQSDNS